MPSVTLERILDLVEASLDERELRPGDLATRAHLSRYHFDRLVRAAIGEPTGAFRRRLLLERAAYRLVADGSPVIEVALDAGYESPDAFARAFVAAFGRTPSRFREAPSGSYDLPATNRIHFHPPGGLRLRADTRRTTMDVLSKMYEHHIALSGEIVDRVDRLPAEVADQPITLSVEGIDTQPTLRSISERLVSQLEMWVAAVSGASIIDAGTGTLRDRLDGAGPRFEAAVVEPIRQGRADETFVDATCEPPQTFTLGGVLAHVLTFSAARRTMAVGALETAGVSDLGAGDPMRYVGGEGDDASSIRRNFA